MEGPHHCTRLEERALRRSTRRLAGAIHRRNHRSPASDRRPASPSLGSWRAALHDRGDVGRHRVGPQHHRDRLCRLPLDVPLEWTGGVPSGRRGRIRQRRRGDGRERRAPQTRDPPRPPPPPQTPPPPPRGTPPAGGTHTRPPPTPRPPPSFLRPPVPHPPPP